jgi:antirestriction protein ArdC
VYTVFNAKQIEGIPEWTPKQWTVFEVVEAAERILNNCGATVRHDQADHAFYNRSSDSIHLPPKHAFKDAASYYGTALHEAAHSSGHPSGLNRATLTESYRFGDISYAKEELRAELASVFLAAERGIPHDPEQHAAYLGAWIKTLKEDKHEIFRAAHGASRAADFLLALERDRSIAKGVLPTRLTLDSAELGDLPAVVLAHETRNRELVPGDGRLGPAPSADSAEKTLNRKTLGRVRTTGRGR